MSACSHELSSGIDEGWPHTQSSRAGRAGITSPMYDPITSPKNERPELLYSDFRLFTAQRAKDGREWDFQKGRA